MFIQSLGPAAPARFDLFTIASAIPITQRGVASEVHFLIVQSGEKPSGYVDTGVTLITDKPQAGVDSKDTKYGVANCWGEK